MTSPSWLYTAWIAALPRPRVKSVVEWARENVKLVASALSESYNPDITPWTREPLECADNGVRRMTFVKPVQAGGSVVGECAICYWIATQNGGDIQANWQNDEASGARFPKRMDKILKECGPVMERFYGRKSENGSHKPTATERFKWKNGLIIFPHCNFIMQGVNTDRNVASDSIRFQVNEEIHDADSGWAPGRLQQCYNRTTAFWNSVIFNISNAGYKGDQLHQAFEAGTQQHWEVKCPGCGQYHRMRTRWDEHKPELGGLRYETFKDERGNYNYTRLAGTIRYQMPCGKTIPDEVGQRRSLSLSGHYSSPSNGAGSEHSYALEAVSVDYIPWLQLIQEKHRALRALKLGDAKPWWDYLRERECQFVDAEDRPIVQRIILSERKKDRAGLPNKAARMGGLDYQMGKISEGELKYWWGVIQDIAVESDGRVHFLTVWEGKLLTDEDAADVMKRHEVPPTAVVCDSGYDAPHVYQFCLKHGFNAIKGSPDALFSHGEEGRKIFSVERRICDMLNLPPTREDEPLFWFYSQSGIMDRLAFLRSSPSIIYEVPGDVSSDFISHMDSWSLETRKEARTGQSVPQWVQHKQRDDLYFCCCYIAMLAEMAGLIGVQEAAK